MNNKEETQSAIDLAREMPNALTPHAVRLLVSEIDRLKIELHTKLLEYNDEVTQFNAGLKAGQEGKLDRWNDQPDNVRVKMCTSFAVRGTPGSGILKAVTKYLNRMELPDVPLSGRTRSPAAIMSDMPADSRMMNLAGKDGALPEWEMLERAAVETCEHCDLNDIASAQMCKDCPAVELLKRLSKLVEVTN